MIHQVYIYSLFAGWVLLFVLGTCLLVVHPVRKNISQKYTRSRKILGHAYLAFGLQVLLQWMFDFRENTPHVAIALNITISYVEAILFGMCLISLLDNFYINRNRIISDFSKYFVCMLMLWPATLLATPPLCNVVQILCAGMFFVDALRIVTIFFKTYQNMVRKVDDFSSENIEYFVRWIYKSVYSVIFFGLTAAVITFCPEWIIVAQMICGIFVFLYIYVSFVTYILHITVVDVVSQKAEESVEKIVEEKKIEEHHQEGKFGIEETEYGDIADEGSDLKKMEFIPDDGFNEAMNAWIEEGGFKESGVTIEQVANVFYTNRTYLSAYLNNVCGCSFRDWINGLRIDASQRIIMDHPDYTIEQIAHEVGFASCSHFGRLFSERVGLTPSKWKKQQSALACD